MLLRILGAAGSGTSRSSIPSTASPYFTTWTAFIATSFRNASNERFPILRVNTGVSTGSNRCLHHASDVSTAFRNGYRQISPESGFMAGALVVVTRRYSDLSLAQLRCHFTADNLQCEFSRSQNSLGRRPRSHACGAKRSPRQP